MEKADSILAQLFEEGRYFLYERGDTIIRTGDTPSGLYLITTGWVKVYSLCEDGEINIIMSLGAGDIFPMDWIVTGRLYDVTFAAVETTTMQRIPKEAFMRALKTRPAVGAALSLKLTSYLHLLSHELENLSYHSARERVAFRLVSLAECFGVKDGNQAVVPSHISNEYIARSTNMTRETASREMSRLAKKDLIKNVDGSLHIKDLTALKRVVGKTFGQAGGSAVDA